MINRADAHLTFPGFCCLIVFSFLMIQGCGTMSDRVDDEPESALIEGTGQAEAISPAIGDTVTTGRTIPSIGTFRMSVIFTRFESDDTDLYGWSELPPDDPADVPDWMRGFISQNSNDSFKAGHFENLTNFFRQASMGKYKVYGQSYYVSLPDSLIGGLAGPANRHAIQAVFGDGEDRKSRAGKPLSELDNWNSTEFGTHVRESNGVIDYVLVVHRWNRNRPHPFNAGWSGFAGIGGGRYDVDEGLTVHGFGPNVSGSTAMFTNAYRGFAHAIHEMGHHLLGSPHPYKGSGGTHPAYWSLFESYIANLSINAWEREWLGWNEMRRIESSTARITLQDFYTTGDAAAFQMEDGAYLVFENRQKLSQTDGLEPTYDNATMNHDDKGLFVYKVKGRYSSREHDLRTYPADGHHVWEVSDWSDACGSGALRPVFRKKAPHPLGISYRDAFEVDLEHFEQEGRNPFALFIYDEVGPDRCHTYTRGIHFETAFGPESLSGNQLFSPFTNPASLRENGDYTGISFYIHEDMDENGGMTVTFSEDPFFRDINRPLRISQDLFFTESTVLPEGTEWHLEEGVSLNMNEETSLRIDGILMLPDGRALTGRFSYEDLQNLDGITVKPLTELSSLVQRASYR